jgi:LacI family transcriptional regulator
MRDVAAEAKVSTMTVSRVLHDDSQVAVGTRKRVLDAVEKLNYRRNEFARNLRLGRDAGVVGLVVANLANPFYSELALGVEAIIAEHSLRLMIGNSGESVQSEEDLIIDFESRRVDGMIVTPAGRDQPSLRRLAESHLPLVLAGTPPAGIDADCVLVDDFGGALDSTRRLIEIGHRRIAFMGNPPSLYTDAERFRGFSTALEEAGLRAPSRYVCRIRADVEGYEVAARELLETSRAPTAIFCANNRITLGVLRAMFATKIQVAAVCFDDFEVADLIGVPLILVSFDAGILGRRAAEMLMDQINHAEDLGKRRITIPTKLVERNI